MSGEDAPVLIVPKLFLCSDLPSDEDVDAALAYVAPGDTTCGATRSPPPANHINQPPRRGLKRPVDAGDNGRGADRQTKRSKMDDSGFVGTCLLNSE